jgi:hypothetical protein
MAGPIIPVTSGNTNRRVTVQADKGIKMRAYLKIN